MHISKFQIRNYKSFLESDEIELKPGFNVIVGKNNSGKTALVEALSLKYQDRPHRSLKTLPSPDAHIEDESTVSLSISLSGDELKEAWLSRGVDRIQISRKTLQSEDRGKEFLAKIRGENLLHCIFDSDTFVSGYLDGEPPDERQSLTRLEIDPIERIISPSSNKSSGVPSYGRVAANQLRERIYYFDAERLNVGNCTSSGRLSLHPKAVNLAEVIHVLQNKNPVRFRRFVQNVQRVLPSIEYITAPQIENSGSNKDVEVQVWNVPVETERHDLAIPLAESGTGIGQVLAILYVVLNADQPSVIIIDEPNSFLHPGAMRRLIGIMKQHPQHQYIVTTHSPAVITAAEPSTLTLARLEGSETKLQTLDVSETEDLRISLAEVGARLSDVFGADDILWVEG
ncbi:MAG: AAA family ATPase, partial [Bacteroidetes bacterium]|nr:AAA family ATPase [Bacteroidota bacterium]